MGKRLISHVLAMRESVLRLICCSLYRASFGWISMGGNGLTSFMNGCPCFALIVEFKDMSSKTVGKSLEFLPSWTRESSLSFRIRGVCRENTITSPLQNP